MMKSVIVVVDDQPFICSTVKTILQDKYEVFTFTSGKDALLYISKNPVDLVLLDYEMPEMTGYEVLMQIKEKKSANNIPVIFLTAETNERMKMEMIGRGAVGYICKPIVASTLHQIIKANLP